MTACLYYSSLSLKPEMHLSGFQEEKKNPQKPHNRKTSGMLIIKVYWFFSIRTSLSGGTTRSERKEKRGEVPQEKTWIFFFGGGGVGWESVLKKQLPLNVIAWYIPIPDGKAPDEMTPVHVLYSCRITFSVALCFTYWQENKALWLCENPKDLDTELRLCKPENTD